MTAFIRRHFLMSAAAFGLLAMALFTVLKEVGVLGGNETAGGGGPGAAAAQASKGPGGGKAGPGGPGGGPGGPGGGPGGAAGRPALVVTTPVVARDFSDRVEVPGTAMSNESIVVSTKVQDVVERVLFESGQQVRAGQVLLVLASTEQSADAGGAARDVDAAFDDAQAALSEIDSLGRDLEAARAGVAEADAFVIQARQALSRTETLAARGFASGARLDADRAGLQAAEARQRAARERVAAVGQRIESQRQRAQALRARADGVASRAQSVRSRLSDRTIRAPFSGVIGLRNVSPGQLARPGDALATLDDVSQLKVDFDVPESRLASLRPGAQVTMRAAGGDGRIYPALVRHVDTRINVATRSVRARAYIPNGDGALKPGMLMSVNLLTPARSMPGVPETALQEEGNASFVFVAQPSDKGLVAKRLPVNVGQRRDGMAEITGGLDIGAQVIVEGLVRLRDGQPVRVQGAPDPSKANAAGDGAPPAKAPAAKPQAAKPQGGGG
jgi:membrane fusion protein (multidrug efflux system)